MFNYETVQNIRLRIYTKIWNSLFKSSFKSFGENVRIVSPARIEGARYIDIRDGVLVSKNAFLGAYNFSNNQPQMVIDKGAYIGHAAHIIAVKDVYIGKNVMLADTVFITDCMHRYKDANVDIKHQPVDFTGSAHIGDGSLLGENVCVLSARIGKHCTIGANSVVLKDIPDYSVAAGNPARIVKKYNFSKEAWERVCD